MARRFTLAAIFVFVSGFVLYRARVLSVFECPKLNFAVS